MLGAGSVKSRFVFVAGLHRTGTSLLAGLLARHPAIGAIKGAPVPEQEGCYLQGAIPHTALHGIPGHFATDPAQHYTEGHALDTMETRDRLWSDWRDWFDTSKPWLLEKSPVNLTRMRLLQALFPTAKFIVILRHPQVMAAALAKWSERDGCELVRYGIDAYEVMAEDLAFLHSAVVLRYEDLVHRPDRSIAALQIFLGCELHSIAHEIRDGNRDYTDLPAIPDGYEAKMAQWGYAKEGEITPFEPQVADPLRDLCEAVRDRLIFSDPKEKIVAI